MNAQPPEDSHAEQGSVFGKLPASRPGSRSPRRDGAAKAKAKTSKAKADPSEARAEPAGRTSKPRPTPTPRSRPAPKPPPEPAAGQPQQGQAGGLDDLAWAGVAAVAEAATIGVRLANRALGALRDSVDRR
jgi:hypothetical protein